jgi:uncharacterized protein (UPF0335 family)
MTYTNLEYIVKQINTLPAVCWHVKANETSREYIGRQDNPDMSETESAGLLVELLDSLKSGSVYITLSKRPFNEVQKSTDKYAGIYKYNFKVPGLTITPPVMQAPPANVGATVPLQQLLDSIQQVNELRLENHTLKQKIVELESDTEGESWQSMLMPVLIEVAKNPAPALAAIGAMFNPKKENDNGNI